MSDLLALINDILQSIIVIFGASVVLYNLKYVRRDRMTRAFTFLLGAVVIVYFTELLVSRTELIGSAESWLNIKWFGITLVPAIQFHLSDTLLVATGKNSLRRWRLIRLAYLASLIFFLLVLRTTWVVTGIVELENATHYGASVGFFIFAIYYWLTSFASIYNVWRAWKRCITTITRRRMGYILWASLAAPLSVFPYLAILPGDDSLPVPAWMWVILIAGNLLVGLMFSLLTANIVYLGAISSDRVVRVRLYKFMARAPLAASLVWLVYFLTPRATLVLGIEAYTATGILVVGTVLLIQWAIHAYKRPLERYFQLDSEPEVRRIQQLNERLLTSQNLRQFLESLLAAGCDVLRVPSAFVTAYTTNGPVVEAHIGRNQPLSQQNESLPMSNDFEVVNNGMLRWQNYWLKPLYTRQNDVLLGIVGLEAQGETWHLAPEERGVLDKLLTQAADALEDRLLQQGVFAAVEGLLPGITAFQQLREATAFSGVQLLESAEPEDPTLIDDPDFKNLVRDALSHYWGGPKLTGSPLLDLEVVQNAATDYEDNPVKGLRAVLKQAIEKQKPPQGEQSLTRTEWLLYNILELKFVQGQKVRDVARRLAMSESDLYRKQRVAIENVARAISEMESERSRQSG